MERRASHGLGVGIVVLTACSAAGPGPGPSPVPAPPASASAPVRGDALSLYVPLDEASFRQNPALLARILATPHGYFRFVNIPFADTVCRLLGDRLDTMPMLNLHGDAHLEQYAVTDTGRGLTDFDDSSTGPGALDLVRFSVSLELAGAERGWSGQTARAIERFYEGYRAALLDPEISPPAPAIVARVMATFPVGRAYFLHTAESLMVPGDFDLGATTYPAAMHRQDASLPEGFFEVQRVGRLRIGIGSALHEKYLIRIAGPTSDPDDDVILEAKEVRSLEGIRCIRPGRSLDPFRILVSRARIGHEPYTLQGYGHTAGKSFWIHAWAASYEEIGIQRSLASPEDLVEIAYDVGAQLGRGHPKHIATPHDLQLREQQLAVLDETRPLLRDITRRMTQLIRQAHARARQEAGL